MLTSNLFDLHPAAGVFCAYAESFCFSGTFDTSSMDNLGFSYQIGILYEFYPFAERGSMGSMPKFSNQSSHTSIESSRQVGTESQTG